jgi:transcriptional regulator GlxA family with amidase domain
MRQIAAVVPSRRAAWSLPGSPRRRTVSSMRVAQIVFDGFTDIDVFLAWDLLNRVRRPGWEVRLLGSAPAHTSATGLTVPMHGRLEEARDADAVLFASGQTTRTLMHDQAWLARLALSEERQLIGSMCSGALLLAALGHLRGRRATTYPTAVDELRRMGVTVVDEPFVLEGRVATAAACLAGVDLAGWVIESLLGAEVRQRALEEVQPVGQRPASSTIESTRKIPSGS